MFSIVLSRRDFREYDQMISLYTKERGKMQALARGVKKITSKNSAHLEPFSLVHVTIEQGKEIDHLTKVQPVEYFSGIRSDLEKSLAARCIVSLTDTLTHAGERDVNIFELLRGWLAYTEGTPGNDGGLALLADGFVVSLFHCLGFTPILDRCVVCHQTFQDMFRESLDAFSPSDSRIGTVHTRQSGLYFAGGGLVCPACRAQKEAAGEEVFDCGLKEVSDMQMLLKGDWRHIGAFSLSPEEQKKVHRLVYEYAVYHSERQIGDWGRVLHI